MTSRRPLAIALIVFGLAVIAVVIWFLILPIFRKPSQVTVQPPVENTPVQSVQDVTPPPVTVPSISVNLLNQQERQAQDALRRLAQDYASRAGTYSNFDDFASIRQVYLQSTPEVQTYLDGVRQELMRTHPALQSSWGQTTRGLASRIVSQTPILNRTDVQVMVEAQVSTETNGAADPREYKEIVLSFSRPTITEPWKVSRMEIKDLQ